MSRERRGSSRRLTSAVLAAVTIGSGLLVTSGALGPLESIGAPARPATSLPSTMVVPLSPAATTAATTAPATTAPTATSPPTTAPAGAAGTPTAGSSTAVQAATASAAPPIGWVAVTTSVAAGVVNIRTTLPHGFGAGTGMVLTATGEILTNSHVIKGATQIWVTAATTGAVYTAAVIGNDPVNDIAVLQLDHATGLTPIPLGNSDLVRPGDPVAAIGNADGQGGPPGVSLGTVIGLDRQITATDLEGLNFEVLAGLIQVKAHVLPGYSGGPLADTAGRVIALNTAASTNGGDGSTPVMHKGYSIPINSALHIAENLVASRAP